MRLLLDTHVLLWLHSDPERLGVHLETVLDPATELLVSVASLWEIALKYGTGRLSLPDAPARWIPSRLRALGAATLAIEPSHALDVADLPMLHRDPFDRLLIVQSRDVAAQLATVDPQVLQYDVEGLDLR